MSQLLATLYPEKYVPPSGRLVPRLKVIPKSAVEENATARAMGVKNNIEKVYELIKQGINTSAEVSDALGYTKATVSGYFRMLEEAGRCYRIEKGRSSPVLMFAY